MPRPQILKEPRNVMIRIELDDKIWLEEEAARVGLDRNTYIRMLIKSLRNRDNEVTTSNVLRPE